MSHNLQLLDGMVVFATVISAGSFTRAAEQTGHSTSWISKEINRLEERLGVRLINRTTRSLHLTDEGQLFFQQCQQIIAEAEETTNALQGHQLQPSGTLRISCPSSYATAQMKEIFSDFLTANPRVDLDLNLSNRKVDIVSEGYDLVVRATPQLEDSSLISRKIVSSRAITLASPAYLADHGTPNQPEQLSEHCCITYSYLKNPRLWTYKNRFGKEINVEIDGRISVNSSEMEMALCKAGHGIARMPAFLFTDEFERGELVELFTDHQINPIDIYLIYPSRKHMSAKVRAFIDFMIERTRPAEG